MRKNWRGISFVICVMAFLALFSITANAATAPTAVQNLRSTTHTLNVASTKSIIGMTWAAPTNITSTTVYYYYVFNTSKDYTITSDVVWDEDLVATTSTTVLSTDYSNKNDSYYFHIVAMIEDNGDELIDSSTTTTKGPYIIDTKAPTNVSVSAPSTTNSQVVTLTLSADGATEMYISNSGYTLSGSWETYATTKQWQLSDGYGSKTVYVSFRDAAGNTTAGTSANSRATITYAANSAPQITDLTAYASGTQYSAPNVYFNIYDKEGGDISLTISTTNATATTPENITVTGISVSGGKTTYTITTTADEKMALTLTILKASDSITSTVLSLLVTDSGGLTNSESSNITFSITESLNVEFSNMSVTPEASGQNLIQWNTTTEIDVAGFLLRRSETIGGPYVSITENLIPSQGNAFSGESYSYIDSQLEPGKIYHYQLVEIDNNNVETIHSINNNTTRETGDGTETMIYDANNDGKEDIADVIHLLQILTDFKKSE